MSLNAARIYAHYRRPERPLKPGSVKITHAWVEDGRATSRTVRPDLPGQTYTIRAGGKAIRNQSVTIEVANEGSDGEK